MKKEIFLNGVLVGEIEATGCYENDMDAVRTFLDERGLRKEIPICQAMFNGATSFANTAAYLYKRDLQRTPRMGVSLVPFIVNTAFALELYLKALSQKHGITPKATHELVKLYRSLPDKAHFEIETVTPKCALERNFVDTPEVELCLKKVNNAFREWRYFYENERLGPVPIEPTIFVLQVLHEAYCLPPSA